MAFIRKIDLLRHQQGSLEQRLAAGKAAVQQALGEGATVMATHDTYALARDKDGVMQRVEYQLQEGQAGSVTVSASDVPVLEGMGLDQAAASDLRGVTEALVNGQPLERTRMRDLCQMLRKDVTYWVDEALGRVEAVGADAAWWSYYAPQAMQIREGLHGTIRELEAPVPKVRFAKMAEERLPEFAAEIRECIAQLRGVAQGLFDALSKKPVYIEEASEAVHLSLRAEAQGIAAELAWVERMDWARHWPAVAAAHDRLASRLRDGLIVCAHLGTREKEQ